MTTSFNEFFSIWLQIKVIVIHHFFKLNWIRHDLQLGQLEYAIIFGMKDVIFDESMLFQKTGLFFWKLLDFSAFFAKVWK